MLTIGNYHYIRENFSTKYPSIFGITPKLFQEQLLLLQSKGDFISSYDLLSDGNSIIKSKENYFFITFDDGLKEQFNFALPILDTLSIPAVFFVNSRNFQDLKMSTIHKIHLLRSILSPSEFLDKIDKLNSLNSLSVSDIVRAQNIYIYDDKESASLKYLLNFKIDFKLQDEIISNIFENYFDEKKVLSELYMSKNEIITLSKNGFLGSHTHNHFPIGLLEKNELQSELQNSKIYLEQLTNTKIELVAYPYGTPEACTEEVAKIAKEVGYKFGFTTSRGVNTNFNNYLLLYRMDCNDLPGGKNYKGI